MEAHSENISINSRAANQVTSPQKREIGGQSPPPPLSASPIPQVVLSEAKGFENHALYFAFSALSVDPFKKESEYLGPQKCMTQTC